MSLDKILQKLETDVAGEIEAIRQSAQKEVEVIRAQAQARTMVIRDKHLEAIKQSLAAEQARIHNQAKLAALKVVTGTRERLINEALQAAACQLGKLPETDRYRLVLQKLTKEAVDLLEPDGHVHLSVHSRDKDLMQAIVNELALSATVEAGLEQGHFAWGCLGGVVASLPDRRITVDNTLDTRLSRIASRDRAKIVAMLQMAQEAA